MSLVMLEPLFDLFVPPDTRGLGGLLALVNNSEKPLPLKKVRVGTSIAGPSACTVVEQVFGNPYDQLLEVVHIFPLPAHGAVVEMEIESGDVIVKAECQERAQAEATFAKARQKGHQAALLTQESGSVHTLRATNLPPKTEIRVRMTLVEKLEFADGTWRWRFPTTIAPRYTPGTPIGHEGPGVEADTTLAPNASRLSPPIRLSGGTELEIDVEIEGNVEEVASSLHAVKMKMAPGRVRVAPSGKHTCDRDFVLAFSTGEPERLGVRAYSDGKYSLALFDPPSRQMPRVIPRDAVFLLDVSGSMQGPKMDAAKKGLKLALRGLFPGDRFKLIAFESQAHDFRADFVAYDDASLTAAEAWIESQVASGGTEMVAPLLTALSGTMPEERLRTVLLITDGQVNNDEQVITTAMKNRKRARLFTLGIDTAVNAAMLGRLARLGGGASECITPQDDIAAAIGRFEKRFGSPIADEIRIAELPAARPEPATAFAGQPAALLVEGAPEMLEIRARTPDGLQIYRIKPEPVRALLGPLWAKERIAYLEDRLSAKPYEEEALKPDIIEIALKHKMASRYTAFVAVRQDRRESGPRVEVIQPVELPQSWSRAAAPTPMTSTGRMAPMAAAMPSAPPPPASRPVPRSAFVRGDADRLPSLDEVMAARGLEIPPPMAAPGAPAFALGEAETAEGEDGWAMCGMGPVRDMDDAPAAPLEPPKAGFFSRLFGGASQEAAPKDMATLHSLANLVAQQGADGSFPGGADATALVLLVLILARHTRRRGEYSRTVIKAATWLETNAADRSLTRAVLEALEAAESGGSLDAGRLRAAVEAASGPAKDTALQGLASLG